MAIWRAQVEFDGESGLPEDKIVNTWHFEGSETATDTANIDDMLSDFYDETYAGLRLAGQMSSVAVSGDVTIKIFCLADPEPRLPRAEYFHTWTVGGTSSLPTEVALCLSYNAQPISGLPQARRRGRVFLGPFLTTNTAQARPNSALITSVLAAASQLLAASQASVTWQWVVYSRRNEAGADVVGGWVDNAWDTQRRRGVKSTARTFFS